MKILTPEEAKAEGYEGYAYHLETVECPQSSDPRIYCASCAFVRELETSGYEAVIDLRGFPAKGE